ncbi:MAG TPA: hypothetical protein VIJ19_11765, partial [Opitutaceae bacterium]
MHVPAFEGFTLASQGGMWAAALWFLLILPAAFTGIGILVRRIPGMGALPPEVLPALGVSAFVLAGGVLNLFRLALPLSVWVLLLAGLAASSHAVWRLRTHPAGIDSGTRGLGLLALALAAFTAATQAMPAAYNWNDDLQSYFTHPVRMIETGTIYGSPLSSVGAVSLGGMAFVQCSALVCLPLSSLNGCDAVLGLVLCLIPLVAYGARHPTVRPAVALAIAGTLVIDPFYVNVSALYLGSSLMIAAVLLTGIPRAGDGAFTGATPLAAGVLYAALVALKPTFLLFAVLHAALVLVSSGLSQRNLGAGLKWAASALAWACALLSPWVLVHLRHYLASAAPAAPRQIVHQAIDLVGTTPLANGFTGLGAYTLLAALTGALGAASLAFGSARWRTAAVLAPASAALAAVAAYPLMLFIFPRAVGYSDADPDAVRYYIPLALGVFPIVLCMASRSVMEGGSRLSQRERLGLCLFLGLLALAGFSGSAAVRLRNAVRYRTLLPYPAAHDPALARATERALGSDKEAQVRALQDRIPAGASVVAWIYTPYFLDYARNRVFDAELAGISNRWAAVPAADYYLWEYRGSADLAARVQRIIDTLPAMDGFRVAPLREFGRRLAGEEASGTVVFRDAE